jgi:hypothetical protein
MSAVTCRLRPSGLRATRCAPLPHLVAARVAAQNTQGTASANSSAVCARSRVVDEADPGQVERAVVGINGSGEGGTAVSYRQIHQR